MTNFEESTDTERLLHVDFGEQEGYNESEDEDYDPTKETNDASKGVLKTQNSIKNNKLNDSESSISDEEYEEEFKNVDQKYKNISNDEGGLIKTRRGRRFEEEQAMANKYESLAVGEKSTHVDELWKRLKERAAKRVNNNESVMTDEVPNSISVQKEEKILIERSYKFAGQLVHEKKWVLASSAEAREYTNSLRFKNDAQEDSGEQKGNDYKMGMDTKVKLRRHLKRPPLLEPIISGAIKPKLTTLEKSKLDWATFVDKEGIVTELQLHNKDGYLAKKDFLARVEYSKDQKFKELRQIQLQQQLQQQQQVG